jgi:hypothetical protein
MYQVSNYNPWLFLLCAVFVVPACLWVSDNYRGWLGLKPLPPPPPLNQVGHTGDAITYALSSHTAEFGPPVIGGSISVSFTDETGRQKIELVPLLGWSTTVYMQPGKHFVFAAKSDDSTPVHVKLEVDINKVAFMYTEDDESKPDLELRGQIPTRYDKIGW